MTPRFGSTLLELLVTLVIIAVIAGVATLALRPSKSATSSDWYVVVAEAQGRAIRTGTATTVDVLVGDSLHVVTALPDGGMLAPRTLPLSRLNGARIDASP